MTDKKHQIKAEASNKANKRKYVAPTLEDVGALVEMTRNGFSKGNDIGLGKSGITS